MSVKICVRTVCFFPPTDALHPRYTAHKSRCATQEQMYSIITKLPEVSLSRDQSNDTIANLNEISVCNFWKAKHSKAINIVGFSTINPF